jgi:hypothetical protein
MIFQKTYLNQGVEVTVEFFDPYFEDQALRRVRDTKIFINALKSRGGSASGHRRIVFKEMVWKGDRLNFTGLEMTPSLTPKELNNWGLIACQMIKEAQGRTHKYD